MNMIPKRNNPAFTLAELLLCLSIIAIIAAIVMPSITQLRPQKNKAMFKKAYNITERIVYELVNDTELYPVVNKSRGLDNVDAVTYDDVSYSGDTKFCRLFARKVNTVKSDAAISLTNETSNCASATDFSDPSFTTTDGMLWIIDRTNFDDDTAFSRGNNSEGSSPTIEVDVNGDTEPNCFDGENGCTNDPDRFKIYVRADGKIKVYSEHAKKYLKDSTLTSQK